MTVGRTTVEVAGIGMHPFGRFEDRTVTDMGVAAVRAALADAGIGTGDRPGFEAAFCGTAYSGVAAGHKVLGALARTGMPIVDVEAGCASGGAALGLAAAVRAALADAGISAGDRPGFEAAFCGTAYSGVAAGHKVLGALARTGMPIVDVEAGCASGGAALGLAAAAIRAGQYDTVLVFGMEKMPRGIIRSSFFEPWREECGLAATPAYFALRAQRLMRERGITKEDLAQVVVKNRAHGALNPDAMYQSETTVEAVLASRVVCDPLHLFMLCSPNEGAAAVVLRRGTGSAGAVRLDAAVLRSHLPGSVLGEATPLAGIDDSTITPPSTLAAEAAYAEAGIGPDDIEVAECQDTDAARELLGWEELRLCAPGDQARLLASGAASLGGTRPINPSGGLLSKGEPLGASGLGQVVELTHQLRGTAGPRQVDGARVALAHTVGRGANASVTILSR